MNYKLFLWKDVLHDYDSGIMGAMAENVEQARDMLRKKDSNIPKYDLAKDPEIFETPEVFICWGGA